MIEVLTTFHKAGWEQYGKRMVESFLQHWPSEIKIHLYCENVSTGITNPQVVEHDIFKACPQVKNFVTQHNNDHNNGIRNGQRDFTGNMIWKWADGREFRGQFQDGAPVQGRLFDSDKAWYDVQYSEDIRISDDRLKPSSKRLAPEEVEKDLSFSRNLEQIHKRLESEEEAYE